VKIQCRLSKELNPNREKSPGVSKLARRAGGGVPPHANFQAVDAMIKVVFFGSASAKFALRAGGGVPPHANFHAVDAMIKVVFFSSASAKFALRAGD